jgi:hypothetical protein
MEVLVTIVVFAPLVMFIVGTPALVEALRHR